MHECAHSFGALNMAFPGWLEDLNEVKAEPCAYALLLMEEIQGCSVTLPAGFPCLSSGFVTVERCGVSVRHCQ